MWLKVDGFKELIKNWWEGYSAQGSFSHILVAKLKALKQDLKVWNKDVFGNVSTQKLTALSQLGQWNAKERERPLTEEKREVRRGVLGVFKKWADLEEISWRQKSREFWLEEGDKNTNLFHKMVNARRRRRYMAKSRVNNELLTEEDEIKEGVASAYPTILSESGEWRPSIGENDF